MSTLRPLLLLGLILFPSFSFALTPRTARLTGEIAQLSAVETDENIRLSLQTPEGRRSIVLSRVLRGISPLVLENNSPRPSNANRIRLFRGRINNRSGRANLGLGNGIAADLSNGTFHLYFFGGRRSRLYTAALPLNGTKHSTKARTARLSHLPSNYPLRCAKERPDKGGQLLTLAAVAPQAVRAGSFLREMRLATDADYDYFARKDLDSAATEDEIARIVNIVAGIFLAPMRISVNHVAHNTFTDSSTGYFQTGFSENFERSDILDEFSAYRITHPFGPEYNEAHLFSGKLDVDGVPHSGIVGFAYLSSFADPSQDPNPGVVCRYSNELSYAVTWRYEPDDEPDTVAYLGTVTAHEIGHNLGLFHSSGIMAPAPTTADKKFNRSNIAYVYDYLDQFGSCLSASGPSLELTTLRLRGGRFTATFTPAGIGEDDDCRVRLYTSSSAIDLVTDGTRRTKTTLLATATISEAPTSFGARIANGGLSTPRNNYFIGELRCSGLVRATTAVAKIGSRNGRIISDLRRALTKK